MFNATTTKISDLVLITSFGEGYYSGATVEECLLIPKSFYDQNEEEIKNFSLSYSELDGKHSETQAKINIYVQPTIEKLNISLQRFKDEDCLMDNFADNLGITSNDLYSFKQGMVTKIKEETDKLTESEQSLMTKILELAETAEDKDIINKLINSNRVMKHLIKHYNSIK